LARRNYDCVFLALAALLAAAGSTAAEPRLERVVLVERHGVRSPTQTNAALDALSAEPWPVWSAAPGELTAHGAQGVQLMGSAIRRGYAAKGLLPLTGCPAPGLVAVTADGADQRTRESARWFVRGLAGGCDIRVTDTNDGDPLFDGLSSHPLDPKAAEAAVKAKALDRVDTPATHAAEAALQAVVAPRGCETRKGVCLEGDSTISATTDAVRIRGPLATASTLAENLLLEYAQGMPLSQVGWGRIHSAADLAAMAPAHERVSDLTRRTPYVAERRAAVLARTILDSLQGRADAYGDGRARLAVFVGHDTNLANLAGAFGLSWTLEDQPDQTAPATVLAFELWIDAVTGARSAKVVVFYQTLDQLRTLTPETVRQADAKVDCGQAPINLCTAFGGP